MLGVVLVFAALLLLVSLFSYDPKDVSANVSTPNASAHNWIGPIGAWLGYVMFFLLGGAAYLMPALLLMFGLSYLFQFMAYFHRRWIWAAVLLFLVCMCWLDLYSHLGFLKRLRANITAPVGGWIGLMLNDYGFRHFGRVGATIIFLMLYLISLLFLTNFQLGEWLRGCGVTAPPPGGEPDSGRG